MISGKLSEPSKQRTLADQVETLRNALIRISMTTIGIKGKLIGYDLEATSDKMIEPDTLEGKLDDCIMIADHIENTVIRTAERI